MRHTMLAAIFALSASAVLGLGCGSGTTPSANSFAKIYKETIQQKCTNDFCHYNGVDIRFSDLDLSSKERAYWSLFDRPCAGPNCQQTGMRVLPGQPEASVMYLKLLDQDQLPAGTSRCGTQMPADKTNYTTNGTSVLTFSGPPLDPNELLPIQNWIQEGAPDN